MPRLLRNLRVTKVALVDEGANGAARVQLFKRNEDNDVSDTPNVHEEQVTGILAKLFGKAQEAAETVTPEPTPVVQDELAKRDTRIAELEQVVEKQAVERDRERFIAKASSLALPGAPADDLGEILRKAYRSLDADEAQKLDAVLNATAAVVRESALMQERGSDTPTATDPWAKIEELAKGKNISVSQALQTPEGQQYWQQYNADKYGRS